MRHALLAITKPGRPFAIYANAIWVEIMRVNIGIEGCGLSVRRWVGIVSIVVSRQHATLTRATLLPSEPLMLPDRTVANGTLLPPTIIADGEAHRT